MISIHDYKTSKLKNYYGASKKVYRQTHVEELLVMWRDLHSLGECFTRTRLTPSNKEFLIKKAIPHYNNRVKQMQEKYPNILEFNYFKPIIK